MELTYEQATAQDIPLLYRFNADLITGYEDPTAIDFEKVLSWVHRKLSSQIQSYTRILMGDSLVGYYRLVPCEGGLELDDFYILPSFRDQGIGSQVLRRCCSSGKSIMLYVFSENTRAIALYERFGFSVTEAVSATRCIMYRPATSQEDL